MHWPKSHKVADSLARPSGFHRTPLYGLIFSNGFVMDLANKLCVLLRKFKSIGFMTTWKYWLMKSEPEEVSIDDALRLGAAPWFGVRNYPGTKFYARSNDGW